MQGGVQGGDVAVPDQPFRVFRPRPPIDAQQQPRRAVSPSGAENGPAFLVADGGVQIGCAGFIAAGKLVFFLEQVGGRDRLVPRLLDRGYRRFYECGLYGPRRCDDGYFVTFFEEWRGVRGHVETSLWLSLRVTNQARIP